MVRLRRSKGRVKTPGQGPQLMERLVRASLQVNPEIRSGENTEQVMERLQGDLGDAEPGPRSRSGSTASGAAPTADDQAARADNISFFLEKRAQDLEAQIVAIDAKRAELDAEQKRLLERVIRQVVDFLATTTSSAAETRKVVRQHAGLVRRLQISDEQLVVLTAKRREQY